MKLSNFFSTTPSGQSSGLIQAALDKWYIDIVSYHEKYNELLSSHKLNEFNYNEISTIFDSFSRSAESAYQGIAKIYIDAAVFYDEEYEEYTTDDFSIDEIRYGIFNEWTTFASTEDEDVIESYAVYASAISVEKVIFMPQFFIDDNSWSLGQFSALKFRGSDNGFSITEMNKFIDFIRDEIYPALHAQPPTLLDFDFSLANDSLTLDKINGGATLKYTIVDDPHYHTEWLTSNLSLYWADKNGKSIGSNLNLSGLQFDHALGTHEINISDSVIYKSSTNKSAPTGASQLIFKFNPGGIKQSSTSNDIAILKDKVSFDFILGSGSLNWDKVNGGIKLKYTINDDPNNPTSWSANDLNLSWADSSGKLLGSKISLANVQELSAASNHSVGVHEINIKGDIINNSLQGPDHVKPKGATKLVLNFKSAKNETSLENNTASIDDVKVKVQMDEHPAYISFSGKKTPLTDQNLNQFIHLKALNVIEMALRNSGLDEWRITSLNRDAYTQAKEMYKNVINGKYVKYTAPGIKVQDLIIEDVKINLSILSSHTIKNYKTPSILLRTIDTIDEDKTINDAAQLIEEFRARGENVSIHLPNRKKFAIDLNTGNKLLWGSLVDLTAKGDIDKFLSPTGSFEAPHRNENAQFISAIDKGSYHIEFWFSGITTDVNII